MSSVSLTSAMAAAGSSEGPESLKSDAVSLREAALRSIKRRGKVIRREQKEAEILAPRESGTFTVPPSEPMAVDAGGTGSMANPPGREDVPPTEDGEIEEGEIEDESMTQVMPTIHPQRQYSSLNDMSMPVDPLTPGHLVSHAPIPPVGGVTPVLNLAHFGVDEMHARPGLEMSRSDYEGAKEIILDLLGWGVSPEHLVDLGLTREVVFYVFDELNLRLPANLDVNGLSPFPPPEVLQAFDRASTLASNKMDMSISPPPSSPVTPAAAKSAVRGIKGLPSIPTVLPSPTKTSSSTSSVTSPRTSAYHNLPPKPPPPQAPTPAPNAVPLSVHALPFTPALSSTNLPPSTTPQVTLPDAPPITTTTSLVTTEQNLNDMQARRKEELLKRKAAMASRKAQASVKTSIVASAPSSATAAPVVHQAVDEFLSSINVVHSSPFISAAPSRTESPDAMDVDPNPSASTSAGTSPVLSPSTVASSSTGASVVRTSSLYKHSVPLAELEQGSLDGRGSGSPPARPNSASRRAARRPTAVELNDDGVASGGGGQSYRLSGFAAVGIAMPLCVIDVSDDEDDSNMDPPSLPRPSMNMPTRLPSRSATPALTSLADTEREIEALRQTIARKEHEKRMKMLSLGMPSSDLPRSKPPTPQLAHATPTVITAIPVATSPQPMSPVSGPSRSSSVNISEENDTHAVEAIVSTDGDEQDILSFDAHQDSDPTPATESLVTVSEQDDEDSDDEDEPVDDDHHVDHATPPIGEFVQSTPHFRPYKSLLGNFPLACTRLGVSVESTHDTSHDPSTALVDINSAQVINNLALINVLVDPNQRLCQYEVPGGGKCRDATCTDVHLDRLLHSATTGSRVVS